MKDTHQLIENTATSAGSAAFPNFVISARFENFFEKKKKQKKPATFWQLFKASAILQHLRHYNPATPEKHVHLQH